MENSLTTGRVLLRRSGKTPPLRGLVCHRPTHSAQVLAERLARHAEEARGTLAPATEALIRTAARRFVRWCAEHGVTALPASGETVAAFIDAMAEQLKPATVGAYVSCIDHLHRAADLLPPPGSTKPARLALKRMRRSLGMRQKQAAPLRWPLIAQALERMGSTPLDLRDAALIALAYDTFCRASEIVALTVGDLEHDGEDASVRIARSKTDQEGEGDYRHVAPSTYARLQAWRLCAGLSDDDPLFPALSRRSTGPLTAIGTRDMLRIVKRRTGEAYSCHSTRVGAAQDARAMGETTGAIQQAGGWKSEMMVARYTARLATRDSAAAHLAKAQGR